MAVKIWYGIIGLVFLVNFFEYCYASKICQTRYPCKKFKFSKTTTKECGWMSYIFGGECDILVKYQRKLIHSHCVKLHKCPINGGWSSWSISKTAVFCTECRECKPFPFGFEMIQKIRNCNNPHPAFGGNGCRGSSEEIEFVPCDKKHCRVDGQWNDWSMWSAFSECSADCKMDGDDIPTKTRYRTRECNNRACDGKSCVGSSKDQETESCNNRICSDSSKIQSPKVNDLKVPVNTSTASLTNITDFVTKSGLLNSTKVETEIEGLNTSHSLETVNTLTANASDVFTENIETTILPSVLKPENDKPLPIKTSPNAKDAQSELLKTLKTEMTTKTVVNNINESLLQTTTEKTVDTFVKEQLDVTQVAIPTTTTKPKPVDGYWSWGSWGSWSTCSKTCEGGTQKRVRLNLCTKPLNGGKPCGDAPKTHSYYRGCNNGIQC